MFRPEPVTQISKAREALTTVIAKIPTCNVLDLSVLHSFLQQKNLIPNSQTAILLIATVNSQSSSVLRHFCSVVFQAKGQEPAFEF